MSEINRKIGELMGWHVEWRDWPSNTGKGREGLFFLFMPNDIQAMYGHKDPDAAWFVSRDLPDWEHDLNTAITLWETIPDTHIPKLVRMVVPQGVLTYRYRGAILCNVGNCSDHDVMNSSPARAICLSWLMWKGVDVEELNG